MANAVPVLMYHHISPAPGLVTVAPSTFRAQMTMLARAGYTTLSAAQLHGYLNGTQAVPEKSVVITFDDGYLDNYVYAYPVLKQLGLHAIIFAVTGWIGEGPARAFDGDGEPLPLCPSHKACKAAIASGQADAVMLRWSEIRAMEASGVIEVHSHTHSHIRWDKEYENPDTRLKMLREDLERSRHALREQTGHDSTHLCWPWGYYETPYVNAAVSAGFSTIYTAVKGIAQTNSDPLRVPRIVVKDKLLGWFARRMWIYSHPLLGSLYTRMRGD